MLGSSPITRWWILPIVLLFLLGTLACGYGADGSGYYGESEAAFSSAPAAPRAAMAQSVADAPVREERSESQAAAAPGLPGRPGPAGAPAAPAAAAKFAAVDESVESSVSSGEQLAQLVVQQRIIIRTVDMGVEVDDVGVAIDDIGEMAKRMGGWIVSSNRPLMHTGSVSVRVPADMLDQAVLEIRALSLRVQYESSDSRDVTDEYVDLSSRLKNTKATEEALLKLLERAEKVDDALAVQSNLSRVQEDVERLQGRIKYLEQTSAYSLLNVSLSEEPREMVPDAGPDVRAGVGEPVRFRASFTPPDGIESFDFTWDFGDGTQVVGGNRTAPTGDGDGRVTATVHHRYEDERDSPYIVQFKITGFGDGGLAEGEDTLIATVSRIPNIEVFAGEWINAEEGETVELSGSFTRPAGLTDMRYTWDFGDGSSPASGSLEEGVTTVVAVHIYANYRPRPYTARLTITGTMETGEVEGSSTVDVRVEETQGWVIGGWSFSDQWKTAIRTLSAVAAAALTGSIWLLVFSPIIAIIVGAAIFLGRRAGSAGRRASQAGDEDGAGGVPQAGP
jgi:hypothetical protein